MTKLKQVKTTLTENNNEEHTSEENAEAIEVFETRWRYAVFPAMIAFIMLSIFGFYLIYGMLQHMQSMSNDINRMTTMLNVAVPIITTDITQLTETIAITMPSIQSNVNDMSKSTQSMAASTKHLDRSTYELNRSISRPMNFMNNMMPFNVDPPSPVRFIE